MKTPATSIPLIAIAAIITAANANDISVTGVSQCNIGGGDIKVTSASCENCNFGEKATLYGTASISSSAIDSSCNDEICMLVTAHAIGFPEQDLFRENFDCSSTSFQRDFDIPDLPAAIGAVTAATIKVQFFEGGCESETRIGCSDITVMSGAMQIGVGVGAALLLTLVGAAAYKSYAAGGGAAAAASKFGFTKMEDEDKGTAVV